MNKEGQTPNWYLIFTVVFSIVGLIYFLFLLFDELHLVVGTFLEGLAFPLAIFLFIPYELLSIPLLIFNLVMLYLIYSRRNQKIVLILPAVFIFNHLVIFLSDSMRIGFSTLFYVILDSLVMLLLVLNLVISIKLILYK